MIDRADHVNGVGFLLLGENGPKGLEVVLVFVLGHHSRVIGDVSASLPIDISGVGFRGVGSVVGERGGLELDSGGWCLLLVV